MILGAASVGGEPQVRALDGDCPTTTLNSNPSANDWRTGLLPDRCVVFFYHQSLPNRWRLFNCIVPAKNPTP